MVRSREGKMNEWFKKRYDTVKDKWGKWTPVQKGILIGIIVVILVAVIFLFRFSSQPTTVRLFNSPVTDEVQRSAIVTRLDQDNVRSYVSQDGYISVDSESIARTYRAKLVAEGYEPNAKDPYALFDTKKWSQSAFNNKVDWQRAQETALEGHLRQLDGIARANVKLSLPEEATFVSEQKPTTASVILFAKPGSDILTNKKQIKGIQHLVMRSVEGLREEDITIVDGNTGDEINDFKGMEQFDSLTAQEKRNKIIRKQESEYQAAALKSLQAIYTDDRVRIAAMKIDMDMSEKHTESEEHTGITIKPDNKDTPYDDSVIVNSLILSEETVDKTYEGTGYNPEGVAGVDGQNPPVYVDASNMIGKSTETGAKRNYALNTKHVTETTAPSVTRLTLSVNIDGKWNYPLYDEQGKIRVKPDGGYEREYVPLSEDELKQATLLVQNSVGYNRDRGDSVVVTNIANDRSDLFREEDIAFRKAQKRKTMILLILIGVAVVLVVFILFRIISREIERRRRLRAEELLRKQQAEREQALWDAKNDGMEVTMSVEERKRAELQENAIAMAKEHPEDVAMLIRTWLMEE